MPNSPPTRLFLTGYRGTGKSTVARLLAAELGWESVDSDDVIEQQAGKTIAAMFDENGEPAFRDLEQQVIAELADNEQMVIALGGGAILCEATRQRLKQSGPVVWLTASPAILAKRLAADPTTGDRRPNLTIGEGKTSSQLAEIEQVLALRTPIYQACADVVVETEKRSPQEIVAEIARWFREQ